MPSCSYPALKNILCSLFVYGVRSQIWEPKAASEALGRVIMLENSKAIRTLQWGRPEDGRERDHARERSDDCLVERSSGQYSFSPEAWLILCCPSPRSR